MDESTTYGRSHVKPNSQNAATNIDRSFESKSGIASPKTQNSMQTLTRTRSATVVCQTQLPSPDSTKTQSWEARKPHWENPPNEKPHAAKDQCRLKGTCQVHSIIYKPVVAAEEDQKKIHRSNCTNFETAVQLWPTVFLNKKIKIRASQLCRPMSGL